MNNITMLMNADEMIMLALREDITSEDITTNSVMPEYALGEVDLICKEDGVIAGLGVFKRVFELLDKDTEVTFFVKDGDKVEKGRLLGKVKGDIRVLLSGERTALNYLQRMSGIATYTRNIADLLKGTSTKLLDTRKTTPNMRVFEKYAVKVGGGYNHRFNLSDGVLLKDNHIGAAGSVKEAVRMAKEYCPFVRKIEIEVENLDTHGDIKRFKTRAAKKLTKDDILIVCGDFGFMWDESEEEQKKIDFLNQQKYQILFVDGTHENFQKIESQPVVDLYSAKAHRITRNIYHLIRGEIYNIDGKFLFAFGGGVSPDLEQLLDRGTWSEREMPTEDEMRYAVENLKKVNCEVDYIVTHEANATHKHKIWRNCKTNPVNLFLEQLCAEVRYKKWFFGNLHADFALSDSVFSVFEEIVPIDEIRKSRNF